MRTMATAGRTVVFSATTVGAVDGGDGAVPDVLPEIVAYTIVAIAFVVALAAVVVTPAAIGLLATGWMPWTRTSCTSLAAAAGPARPRAQACARQFWYRSTRFVLRHAIPIGMGVVALLLLLGVPFLGVKWGFPDERVLPHVVVGTPSGRHAGQRFRQRARHRGHRRRSRRRRHDPADLQRYAAELSRVPDVSSVSAPDGTFVGGTAGGAARRGHRDGARQRFSYRRHHRAAVLAGLQQPTRPAARVATPAGRSVEMTGFAQINRDSVDAITTRLPLVLGSDRRASPSRCCSCSPAAWCCR